MNQAVDRSTSIGGSDIGAIMGVNPYRSPWDVWAEKAGHKEPSPGNEATRFGNRFEAGIADEYADLRKEDEPDVMVYQPSQPYYTDQGEPWMRGTPDRLVRDAATRSIVRGLEIKTAGLFTPTSVIRDQWGEGDDVPSTYYLQCVWYMRVLDVPRWDLAAFIGGVGYRDYVLMRDLELEAHVVDTARKFYGEHMLKGVPPPVDASEGCDAALRSLYPAHRRNMLVATPEMAEAAAELRASQEHLKEAEDRTRLAKNNVQSMIGDAEGMHNDDFSITWKASNRTDHEAAAREAGVNEAMIREHSKVAWGQVTKAAKVSKAILAKHVELRGGPRSLRSKWAQARKET